MNTVQQSIYAAKLLIYKLLGQTPVIDAKATINERLDIFGTDRPSATENVKLGVLIAGNKGHRVASGTDGIPLISIVDHMADNASLYSILPFLARTTDDDIDLSTRNKYALRKLVTVGGINYYFYYGLRMQIDPEAVKVTMKYITTEDGQTTETPFIPDTKNLYPEQPNLPDTGAVTTTDVRMAASAIINVKFNEEQISEFVNAIKILYGGDERYAVMSEFALCTQADRQKTVDSTAGQINFIESIGTQVYSFAADHKAMYYNSQELTLDFDIGNQIPLLGTRSIPTLETIGVLNTNTTGQ